MNSRNLMLSVLWESCIRGAATLCLCLSAGVTLHAQGVVKGTVIGPMRNLLVGAEVSIVEAGFKAEVGPTGTFLFTSVVPGTYTISARAIGYKPYTTVRLIGGEDTVSLEIHLAPFGQVLPSLEVRGESVSPVPPKLLAWHRRKEIGQGVFMDSVFLRQQEHNRLPDVLARVSTVRAVRFADGRGRAIATARGRTSLSRRGGPGREIPNACYMAVFLDGALIYKTGSFASPPNLDDFPVQQIAAIEIYRSPAQMPPELNVTGADCGAVAIWTR